MWALGGNIAGGKVYGRWPGIDASSLNEGRDLAVTTDFRQVLAGVCAHNLGLSDNKLASVFPGFDARAAEPRARLRASRRLASAAANHAHRSRRRGHRSTRRREMASTTRDTAMILEHADFTIPAGKNAEFEEAIQRGIATVISQAKGFRRRPGAPRHRVARALPADDPLGHAGEPHRRLPRRPAVPAMARHRRRRTSRSRRWWSISSAWSTPSSMPGGGRRITKALQPPRRRRWPAPPGCRARG